MISIITALCKRKFLVSCGHMHDSIQFGRVTHHMKRGFSRQSAVKTIFFCRQILSLPDSWLSTKIALSATFVPRAWTGCWPKTGRLRTCFCASSQPVACPRIPISLLKCRLHFGLPGHSNSGISMVRCSEDDVIDFRSSAN